MDLIVTDATGKPVASHASYTLDLAFGSGENDFDLQVEDAALKAGSRIMIDGTEYGGMDTMPDIVGLGLWKQGHWGVYVGNGYAIEAMGTQYGVVRTKVEGRGWQGWCKIPYIQYDE